LAPPTVIEPLEDDNEQHVKPETTVVPVLTSYDDEVETSAKLMADTLVIVKLLPEAIVM